MNNISTSNAPLSIPIRSDFAEYMGEKASLSRLLFDQILATREPAYFRAEAGMLETMFGGVDAEAALPLWNGRILAGASGSLVRKRAPGEPFQFLDSGNYHTALLQGRLNVPEIDAAIDVKLGRFLAGDRGVRVEVSKFVRGVTLSAWYSATDTDVFTDPYNRGLSRQGDLRGDPHPPLRRAGLGDGVPVQPVAVDARRRAGYQPVPAALRLDRPQRGRAP